MVRDEPNWARMHGGGKKKSLHEHKRIRKSTESKKSRFSHKETCKREQRPGGPRRPTCSKAGEEQTVLGGRGIQKANSPGKLQNSNSLETSVCSKTWTSVGTRHERISSVQFNHSVVSDCLLHPMDCSTPGLPVRHQLRELAQTHVHRVGDAIQPPHPLSSPSPPALILSQHQGLFK